MAKRFSGLPFLSVFAFPVALVYGYKWYYRDVRLSAYQEVSHEQYIAGYRILIGARMSPLRGGTRASSKPTIKVSYFVATVALASSVIGIGVQALTLAHSEVEVCS